MEYTREQDGVVTLLSEEPYANVIPRGQNLRKGDNVVRSALSRVARLFGVRETHGRSIAKAVSWRATGSLDTFIISWIVTGNTTIAGSIALIEIATKILIYYLHERAWVVVPWGRR